MAPLVSGDDVKSGGEAKPDAAHQRIRESNPGKVQVGICAQVFAYFVL